MPAHLIATMEQTDIKDLIKEALHLLKNNIVIAFQNEGDTNFDNEIENLAQVITNMTANLEELAFNAGRMQEDNGDFTFDDFKDFQDS